LPVVFAVHNIPSPVATPALRLDRGQANAGELARVGSGDVGGELRVSEQLVQALRYRPEPCRGVSRG